MALIADQQTPVQDGDQAFYRVDTRRPAHELEAGVVAEALNCRFEDGRAWPRLGVNRQPWGVVNDGGAVKGFNRFNDPQGFDTQIVLTDDWRTAVGEDGGRGRAWRIQSANVPSAVPLNGHDVWGVTRAIPCYNGLTLLRQGNERHYFSAVTTLAITNSDSAGETISVTTTTVATGMPVTVAGITGASGTYYVRIIAAGLISLYDTAAHANAGGATGRFNVTVNSQTGTLSKLAVDPATARIQLNVLPNWTNGDRVIFYADTGSYFTGSTPPQNATSYFVKNITGNLIELYSNQGLSTKLAFTVASGRFWLERNADFPGFYGNVSPPLLAQPNSSGNSLWEVGFKSMAAQVLVTNTDISTNICTAPNHRMLAGDFVTVTGVTTLGPVKIATAYVAPVSEHALKFYTTQLAALAGDIAYIIPLVNAGEQGTIVKAGASGLPTPGGSEGAYYQNRLIIVNGRDTVAISDPLDPLHFAPFTAAVTANLGESDKIMAVVPMGTNDALLVLKENSLGLINNFSGGPAAWTFTSLTREYGCVAPLTVQQVGADVWFLSRKGIASVIQTANGVLQGVADPVSKQMQKYINQIDWWYAANACAGYWNNRYFVALPLKGQAGAVLNNGVLVHNFLNMATSVASGGGTYKTESQFGWEGLWQGAELLPVTFARLTVYGDERLCFVSADGQIGWLGEGWTDGTTAIISTLTTRRYAGGGATRKLWLTAQVTVDALAPSLTVTAIFPGVNETQVLVANKTFDKTKYLVYGAADYNPATANPTTFNAPFRADYKPSAAELLAGPVDVHQNHPLPLRMRRSEWGVQLQIQNTAGSARIQSVNVGGLLRELAGSEAV